MNDRARGRLRAVAGTPTQLSKPRPNEKDLSAARRAVERMLQAGILKRRGRPPNLSVVACAIRIHDGEVFANDSAAKRAFGVPENFDVRRLWVEGKFPALLEHERARREEREAERRAAAQAEAEAAREAKFAARQAAHEARRGKQCEGMTHSERRCKITARCGYKEAAPLLAGGRFCVHHDPTLRSAARAAFEERQRTAVRCIGIRPNGHRCRVTSAMWHKEALPLKKGSSVCFHHRVKCAGVTKAGVPCCVTSASLHDHAEPLRRGEQFCAHHAPVSDAASSEEGQVCHQCDPE